MKPQKNGSETPVELDESATTALLDAPATQLSRATGDQHFFFSEPNMDRLIENLDSLRSMVAPALRTEGESAAAAQQPFPSVCLVGLGRCGSNIALDVASLVYNARQFYVGPPGEERNAAAEPEVLPRWVRNGLLGANSRSAKGLFLIEPLVMLGDLDKDIAGRIRFSRKGEGRGFLNDYNKMKVMDLSEVHAGGAGNSPILGQYLAKIILNQDVQNFANPDWKAIHSYLIDSCGIKANQSRLYFYIFSAGGGTGSGMASEFGLAQQYAYIRKTFEVKKGGRAEKNRDHGFVFEPIFTTGICVLPNLSDARLDTCDALHINAGRMLCKYLSEEWDFSYNFDAEAGSREGMLKRVRPWNAMMLISNDIMRHAEESGDANTMPNFDVTSMERYANQYISQQIFNILTAQAVTTDYDQNYFRRAGIDIGETIRLDANDLFMSLAGPVVVAYAESVVPEAPAPLPGKERPQFQEASRLDVDDLFFRSIDLPHFNKNTQAIEGISLLPIEAEQYRQALDRYRKSEFDASSLSDLHFFNNCSSVVCILSLPKDYKLSYVDLNRLKTHLNSLFPNTTLKRYALVIGASANLSLTTLVVKSPCLSDEFLTLLSAYVKRCFARDPYRFDSKLDEAVVDFITAEKLDEEKLEEMLAEHENPAKILDTNWYAIKPMYEKKYQELIEDKDRYISINDIRLGRDSVKKAILYLREIYRHRISKTRVVSLQKRAKPKGQAAN